MGERSGLRVLVTGFGPVSSIGIGKEPFWTAAQAGRSGGRAMKYDWLTTERFKYVLLPDGREQLFDHDVDPFELSDAQAEHPDVVAELQSELARRRAEHRERAEVFGAGSVAPIDPALVDQLEELGYVERD